MKISTHQGGAVRAGEVEEDSCLLTNRTNLCCKFYQELRTWDEFFQPIVRQVTVIVSMHDKGRDRHGCSMRYGKEETFLYLRKVR